MITKTGAQVPSSAGVLRPSLGACGPADAGNDEDVSWPLPWVPVPLTERGQPDELTEPGDEDDEALRFAAELGRRAWRRQAQNE